MPCEHVAIGIRATDTNASAGLHRVGMWNGINHLPFPLLSVEWLEIAHLQEVRDLRLPVRKTVIDHSGWIVDLLRQVGLDCRVGATMIRVFGYSPQSDELFDR